MRCSSGTSYSFAYSTNGVASTAGAFPNHFGIAPFAARRCLCCSRLAARAPVGGFFAPSPPRESPNLATLPMTAFLENSRPSSSAIRAADIPVFNNTFRDSTSWSVHPAAMFHLPFAASRKNSCSDARPQRGVAPRPQSRATTQFVSAGRHRVCSTKQDRRARPQKAERCFGDDLLLDKSSEVRYISFYRIGASHGPYPPDDPRRI